ncbi:RHS repeat-associated core domain-containing protein [Desulforamulus aeronauticus]|uniref:RHS repeat-associated core domain-containing protein n=1 Tax=Desulforamulus aeronauticus TaxID=53343 RepID=UPI003B75B63E
MVNRYAYDEWGNILSKQEQVTNPLRYAGEYYDDESGLYHLRSRYYDPTIGRFISRDSYEGDINNPLSLNLYTYVENDPLSYVDPSGHSLIGVVIGLPMDITITDN